MASNNGNGTEAPKRVGLAIQGGVIPAGAFAAGVISGLAEKGAFEEYDICAFSGTSSGALVATLCWAHRVLDSNGETLRCNLMADLEKMWMYLAPPNHLAVPIWHPMYGEFLREVDSLCMKSGFYREWVKNARTPYTRFVQQQWIKHCIPLEEAKQHLKENLIADPTPTKREDRIGLVLGSADVLRGEITTFREDEISVAAVLASGSFEEFTGLTTIATPPHAGTYIDGAWGDNPPINELLDYGLHEIWFITCWPKAISDLPHTPAERKERQNELWQNSLVEHEMDVAEFVNYWRDALNDERDKEGNILRKGAIRLKVEQLQEEGKLPGESPDDDAVKQYLRALHAENGELPKEFSRLFDEANGFQLKHYKDVKIKRIERLVPRELGDIIVNVPWYIRNMMRHGCERAHDFADRDFGNVVSREPTAPLPGIWAYTPKPFDDHAYDVRSHAAECALYEPLDIVCDLCPKTFVNGALDLLLPDVLPQKAMLDQTSQLLCDVCPIKVERRLGHRSPDAALIGH